MVFLKKNFEILKRTQLFWDIIYHCAQFFPKSNFKKIPESIIIELTNACNLHCPVCPTPKLARKKGFMSLDTFKKMVDEFKPYKTKPYFMMNFAGEPVLHKEISEFVKYAEQAGHKTFISTNATFLTAELSERLIRAGLSNIHLCLDGFTKNSHEAYRQGSSFEQVKANIEQFIKIKKSIPESKTKAIIQTLITAYSEDEMNSIKDWAQAIGADAVNFKSFSLGTTTTNEEKTHYSYLLPSEEKLKRLSSGVYRTLCSWPLRSSVVYWNGDLGLCCIDFEGLVPMQNIENGYLKAYHSKDSVQKRFAGFRKQYSICKTCSLSNADSMGYSVNFGINRISQ